MRVFTKHIKVLGLAKHELDAMADMLTEARRTGKAERSMSPTEYLAIEVDDRFEYSPHNVRPESKER